jgi:hypothetical protein
MRVYERVSERAHAEGHLRYEVTWKVQCLSFCGLSIPIVGETAHIPRPLYKPTLRNCDLQASHGTAGCGGRFLSGSGRGFGRTPVLGVKFTPAARETVVIHYGSDVCCLEAAEKTSKSNKARDSRDDCRQALTSHQSSRPIQDISEHQLGASSGETSDTRYHSGPLQGSAIGVFSRFLGGCIYNDEDVRHQQGSFRWLN